MYNVHLDLIQKINVIRSIHFHKVLVAEKRQ